MNIIQLMFVKKLANREFGIYGDILIAFMIVMFGWLVIGLFGGQAFAILMLSLVCIFFITLIIQLFRK